VTFTAGDLTRTDDSLTGLRKLVPDATHPVTFAFDRTIVSLRFHDCEAARLHRSRYRHMLASAEPALTFYIAAPGQATYFWLPDVAAFRWDRHALTPENVSFLADAVATTLTFESLADSVVLHAGVVADSTGAAAIVGTTEAGKTTTSIACTRRGLTLLTDEFCVATPRGVVPFPRTLNLRRGGIELLAAGARPGSPLGDWLLRHGGADRNDVGFDELFSSWQPPAPRPLRALFLVTGRGATPEATPSTAARMLPRLLPWSRMKSRGLDAARELLALLQTVACFELVLGSPDDTAQLIAETLARGPRAHSVAIRSWQLRAESADA